ncbi:ABC transporter ATP-binding protein [Sandaracinobacteroides saxicola]|uniref:ABC transporter ATP-binding protein n=1 Tax=Sandaracinobacteroides saxicola TaxID=2759707 RepID=A0A7G5IIU2_9SPHN|nr:ABC transporter ATP-binding protein [Sandaracinobacteroides saxicola]QMW23284.1 ABC transporter ATP-binding protein [Sandaracinobacteroides saxicola]
MTVEPQAIADAVRPSPRGPVQPDRRNPAPRGRAVSASPAAVQFLHVVKRYGTTMALDDVSFAVPRGEMAALVGPNGAGKTSILEMIMGLRRPDAGSVLLDRRGGRAGPTAPTALRIGAQLQDSRFYGQMTPHDYLRLFARLEPGGISPESLIADFGLDAFVDRRIAGLSGGQRQRLALALSVINDPDLVILDEPTVGLDPIARQDFWALIRRLHDGGRRTLLFSTHYMEEVRSLATSVLMLSRGRLVATGSVDAVVATARGAASLDEAYATLVGQGTITGAAA